MPEPTKPGGIAVCRCPACRRVVSGVAPDFGDWGDIRCDPCRRTGVLRWAGTPPRLVVDGFYPVVGDDVPVAEAVAK
jgi:hypothetical protein